MKDRRMWVIIGCILVVGIAITSYTSSVVKRTSQEQQVQVLSADTAKKAIGKEKELQAAPEEVGEKSRGFLQEKEVTGEETALAEDEGAEVQSVETKEESYTERLEKIRQPDTKDKGTGYRLKCLFRKNICRNRIKNVGRGIKCCI